MASTRNFYAALINLTEEDAGSSGRSVDEEDTRPHANGAHAHARPPKPAADAAATEAGVSTAAPSGEGTPQDGEAPDAAAFERALRLMRGAQLDRPKLAKPLVWVDLEMTGLDLAKDTIIEIACLVSDGSLEHVIEGPEIAIHQSEEVLAAMNKWCLEHHGASGLTERCRASTTSMAEAEQQVLAFLRKHVDAREARLAGNSVHVDAAFLKVWMPDLAAHLHYRIVDVSTVAELCNRWFPAEYKRTPRKKAEHTAMADIKESLQQLRYYKGAIFKQARRR